MLEGGKRLDVWRKWVGLNFLAVIETAIATKSQRH